MKNNFHVVNAIGRRYVWEALPGRLAPKFHYPKSQEYITCASQVEAEEVAHAICESHNEDVYVVEVKAKFAARIVVDVER